VGRSPAVLAAAALRPARLGGWWGYTRSPELLRDLARAVDCCAAGERAGSAACSGDVPGGPTAHGREVVREGEGDGLVYRRPTCMPVTKGPTAHA
jgi:hypothetical protein